MSEGAQVDDGVITLSAADGNIRLSMEGSLVNPAVARFTLVAADGTETAINNKGGSTWVSTNQTGPIMVPIGATAKGLDGCHVDVTFLLRFYWKAYKGEFWKAWLAAVVDRGGKARQVDSQEIAFKRTEINTDTFTLSVPLEVA